MKSYVLLLLMMVTLAGSCKDDSDNDLNDPKLFEWLVGEESDQVIRNFEVDKSAGFEIMADINSLCPNTGITMKIERDGKVVIDSFIVDFPSVFSVETEGAESIHIETGIQMIEDSEIVCVWLGNAKISGSY